MGLTFENLKERVGKNLKYYNDTDGWKTDRDVTETDIGEFVNEIYTEELFPLYASRYPHLFRQTGYLNSWLDSFTVSASSTSTTLVSGTSVFTNGMVGLTLYNETDDEYAVIDSYTNATTVTLDTTIGDTWDGDTVYILGQVFTFGGDAVDLFTVESISLRYNSTDINISKAEMRDEEDVYFTGDEIGSQSRPLVYLTSVNTATGLQAGFGILPKFTKKVTKGIKVVYIAKPSAMTNASDVPILPIDSSLIAGATARAFEEMQEFQKANYWMSKYELKKKQDLSRYKPQTSNRPVQIKLNRNVSYIHRRII